MPREGGAGSRASLPGARRRLVRARDADALVLGRRHKRSECVVSRRFLSRHACLRSRPPLHRLAAVFGSSRFGATERRPRTFDTASRRTKDERVKITTRESLGHRPPFAFRANEPTNPLSSLTRERPFPRVYTRAFLTPSRENTIPFLTTSAFLTTSRRRAALMPSTYQ